MDLKVEIKSVGGVAQILNNAAIIEKSLSLATSSLLLEDNSLFLQEDGSLLLLEQF